MRLFRTIRAVPLILGFILVTFGCAISVGSFSFSGLVAKKNQVSGMEDVGFFAETVPEGILLSFSHIPQETMQLNISFQDWGDIDIEPDWENIEVLSSFDYYHEILEIWSVGIMDSRLEQLRETRNVILPFVRPGHKYTITAYFSNSGDLFKTASTECVADRGIFYNKGITLDLNNAYTGVALSSVPEFSSEVQFGQPAIIYSLTAMIDDIGNGTAINSGLTDDLSWNFEPGFSNRLKEEGIQNGKYQAFAQATCNIIHDDITWVLEVAKTPIFTYSF